MVTQLGLLRDMWEAGVFPIIFGRCDVWATNTSRKARSDKPAQKSVFLKVVLPNEHLP